MKDTNSTGIKKELYFLLNIAIIILGAFLSKINLFLSIFLGILFIILCAYATTSRTKNRIYKIIFSVFSPFFIVATYIWLLYLFKDTHFLWVRIGRSYKYYLLFGIILDLFYCKSIQEISQSNNKSIHVGISNINHGFSDINTSDPYLIEAGKFVTCKKKASVPMIQRAFRVNSGRATEIMNELAKIGVIKKDAYSERWEVVLDENEFNLLIENELTENNSSDFSTYNISDCQTKCGNITSYDQLDGYDFEKYCTEVLGNNNFYNIELTPGSGDQGIDIIAYKDGIKYGIQCKRYSSDVGNFAVQEAFSGKVFYNCHVAVVLTNRYFTRSAKELAEKNGVLLWDRDKLDSMISNEN